MKVNSEAVIGANVWRKSMEGPTAAAEGQFQDQKELKFTNKDYRFTINHGNIYAIALQCPKDGVFCIVHWQTAVIRMCRSFMVSLSRWIF